MLALVYNVSHSGSYAVQIEIISPQYMKKLLDAQDVETPSEHDAVVAAGISKGLTEFNPLDDPALALDAVFSVVDNEVLPDEEFLLSKYYDHASGTFVLNEQLASVKSETSVEEYLDSLEIGIGDDFDTSIQIEIPQNLQDILTPEKLVEVRLRQLERRFEFIMNWITHKYTRDEISSWSEQKRDVDCWEALGSKTVENAPDGLKSLAMEAHGITDEVNLDPVLHIQERADDVAVNANFYRPYSLGAVGKKKKHRKSLKDKATDTTGKTPAEVTAMKNDIMAIDTNDMLSFGIQKFIDAGLL